MPLFLHLLRPCSNSLTVKYLVQLLKPEFSEEGSNNRRHENAVYAAFQKYLREIASTLIKFIKFFKFNLKMSVAHLLRYLYVKSFLDH